MVSTKDIAWLAGLLEGEGSFTGATKRHPGSIRLAISSTDYDILERVSALLGNKGIYGPYMSKLGKKPYHTVCISGSPAVSWMMTLYTLMGTRRRARIRELITAWRSTGNRPNGYKPNCHPDRKHKGKGLCVKCYDQAWYQERKRRAIAD